MTGRNYKTIIHIIKININKLIVQERVFTTPKSFDSDMALKDFHESGESSVFGTIEK